MINNLNEAINVPEWEFAKVFTSKDKLEPKKIYISTAGLHDGIFAQLMKEYQRGLRAKIPSLYNDVMTADGLMLMTNEEIEAINSIGCTSFMLTSEQIEQLLKQYEKRRISYERNVK